MTTVWDAFEAQARRRPDAVAIRGAAEFTYGELAEHAEALARELRTRTRPGTLVALDATGAAAGAIAFLATARAGRPILPLSPDSPPRHRAEILNRARPGLLLREEADSSFAIEPLTTDAPGAGPVSGTEHVSGPGQVSGVERAAGVSDVSGAGHASGAGPVSGVEHVSGPEHVPDVEHGSGVEHASGPGHASGMERASGVADVSGVEHAPGAGHASGVEHGSGPEHVPGVEHGSGVGHVSGVEPACGPGHVSGVERASGVADVSGVEPASGPGHASGVERASGVTDVSGVEPASGAGHVPGVEHAYSPGQDAAAAWPPGLGEAAYVMFTSGSTGTPKGVVVSHDALLCRLRGMARRPGFGERDSFLAMTALSFDPCLAELLMPLIVGGQIVAAPPTARLDPEIFAETVRADRPSVIQATPSFWRLALTSGWTGAPDSTLWCGGEALTPGLAARLLPVSAALWNVYGPTETTVWSCAARVTSPDDIGLGRPLDGTGLTLAATATDSDTDTDGEPDSEVGGEVGSGTGGEANGGSGIGTGGEADREADGGTVADGGTRAGGGTRADGETRAGGGTRAGGPSTEPGRAGEILLYGDTLALGYLGRPDLTAERFAVRDTPDGPRLCYATGDRARYRADGRLEFLGRTDAQVKLRGHRIELGELEVVLERHPAVREAVVVLRDADDPQTAHLAAFVAADGGLNVRELRAWLAERLPLPMRPARILIRDDLPRTTTGKVDRVGLAAGAPMTSAP